VKGLRKLQQGSWNPHQEDSSLWTPGLRKTFTEAIQGSS
jgi:hypothetical protein